MITISFLEASFCQCNCINLNNIKDQFICGFFETKYRSSFAVDFIFIFRSDFVVAWEFYVSKMETLSFTFLETHKTKHLNRHIVASCFQGNAFGIFDPEDDVGGIISLLISAYSFMNHNLSNAATFNQNISHQIPLLFFDRKRRKIFYLENL